MVPTDVAHHFDMGHGDTKPESSGIKEPAKRNESEWMQVGKVLENIFLFLWVVLTAVNTALPLYVVVESDRQWEAL